jgi:hypothetical protein
MARIIVKQISSNKINIYKNGTSSGMASFLLAIMKPHNILPFHRHSSIETSAHTAIAMATAITPTMPATTRTKARKIK